jgi:hemerythrin-like domain-containing protein
MGASASTTAGWRSHPNAAGPASLLLSIHDQFRAASARLLVLVERDVAAIARVFIPLADTLRHHHHAEEAMLFPLVLGRTGVAPAQLVDDHGRLTAAIVELETSLAHGADRERTRSAVASFHEILIAHLDREESLVIPVLLEMTPHEAWSLIHGAGSAGP